LISSSSSSLRGASINFLVVEMTLEDVPRIETALLEVIEFSPLSAPFLAAASSFLR